MSEAQEMDELEELILHHVAPELDADAVTEDDQAIIALLEDAMLESDHEDATGLQGVAWAENMNEMLAHAANEEEENKQELKVNGPKGGPEDEPEEQDGPSTVNGPENGN